MPGLYLTTPSGRFSARDRYVLTTFLNTLAIPHKLQDEEGYLIWPCEKGDAAITHEIDTSLWPEAFDLLARTEEQQTSQRDEMGRFTFAQSTYTPDSGCRVDEILERFAAEISQALAKQGQNWQPKPIWPEGAPFAVCLTHDIDWTRKWTVRGVVGHAAADGLQILRNPLNPTGWQGLFADVRSVIRRENPFWNLGEIARREKDSGFRSTFFFLANGGHPKDGDYSIDEPRILRQMEQLLADGFEIGLHGSYMSLEQPKLLEGQLARLQSKVGQVLGIRQHYLRFDVQRSLRAYEKLGLNYDTTMGYADREGFRAGFSFPYYPYCLAEERPFRVLEIPLTVMDTTLEQYRGLNAERAWTALERQLQIVRRSGGCCTILWHNTFFDGAKYPGYGDVYWRALAWIAEHGGWGTTAAEIWSWWRDRTSVDAEALAEAPS